MSFLGTFFCILLSAGLLAAAIPNEVFFWGNSFAGMVCLIPLYCTFVKSKSLTQTALSYSFMAVFTHLFSSFWLVHFQDFAIFTLGGSALANFFLAYPFGAAFYYACTADIRYRAFAFALIWTLWEFFKSSGFLAYPWGTIIMTARDLKYLIQFIDVTGVWGLSFIMPLISAILAEILLALSKMSEGFSREKNYPVLKPLIFTAVLLVLINIYGFIIINSDEKSISSIKLALIQQNSDSWSDSNFEESVQTGQNLTRSLLKKHEKPDLIVWSETSLSLSYTENKYFYENFPTDDPFIPFLKEVNKPFLIGTPIKNEKKTDKYSNGVCLISPDGEISDSYSKIQLVPFAEFMPLIDNPVVKKFFSAIVGFSSGWEQGKEYKIFKIFNSKGEIIKFSAPICYEDAFPSLCAKLHMLGSDIMINLTNDSWSKTVSAEYQHFTVASFRAIELRAPLVRSTNSGYTSVINPKGEIIADLPLFNEAALYADIPIYAHKNTPYAVFKDWLPFVFFIILIKMLWSRQLLFVKRASLPVYAGCHWCENEEGKKKFKRRIRRIKTFKRMKLGVCKKLIESEPEKKVIEKPETKKRSVSKKQSPELHAELQASSVNAEAKPRKAKTVNTVKNTAKAVKKDSADEKKTVEKKSAGKKRTAAEIKPGEKKSSAVKTSAEKPVKKAKTVKKTAKPEKTETKQTSETPVEKKTVEKKSAGKKRTAAEIKPGREKSSAVKTSAEKPVKKAKTVKKTAKPEKTETKQTSE